MKKPLLLFIFLLFLSVASFSQQDLLVKSNEKGLYLEHTVAAKEGLYSIGRLYNVNPKTIAAYNKLDLSRGLDINQTIRIPLTDTNFSQNTNKGFPVYYVPGAGEGLMKISNTHKKVTLANLRTWNKLAGDNVKAGEKMIVGFLQSKDFQPSALVAKPGVTTDPNVVVVTGDEIARRRPVNQEELATEAPSIETPKEGKQKNQTNQTPEPVRQTPEPLKETKQPLKETRQPLKETPDAVKEPREAARQTTEPVQHTTEAVITQKANTGSAEAAKPAPVAPQPVDRPANNPADAAPQEIRLTSEDGFFKSFFDQQIRVSPVSKNQTVTSGIFKTSSGWQDSKYYLLIDGVATGTIVRLINPDNNRAVYAKVLGEMNGIRQNQGLGIRISNAAASALGIKEEDKFIVRLNY